MNVSAIILAGGNSSRMKYNKEFIKIGDEFLVHKQIKKLQSLFDEVIIVSNNKEHYKDYNVLVVNDILIGNTPIIGLHSGLVNSSNKYNYVIACDMAFINIDFIEYMISLLDGHEAYVAKYNNYIEPFNAIYSKSIIPKIESFLEKRGLKIVNHLDNKEIEKTFLLNENGSLVGQITGSFRFAMASPNNDPQNK